MHQMTINRVMKVNLVLNRYSAASCRPNFVSSSSVAFLATTTKVLPTDYGCPLYDTCAPCMACSLRTNHDAKRQNQKRKSGIRGEQGNGGDWLDPLPHTSIFCMPICGSARRQRTSCGSCGNGTWGCAVRGAENREGAEKNPARTLTSSVSVFHDMYARRFENVPKT